MLHKFDYSIVEDKAESARDSAYRKEIENQSEIHSFINQTISDLDDIQNTYLCDDGPKIDSYGRVLDSVKSENLALEDNARRRAVVDMILNPNHFAEALNKIENANNLNSKQKFNKRKALKELQQHYKKYGNYSVLRPQELLHMAKGIAALINQIQKKAAENHSEPFKSTLIEYGNYLVTQYLVVTDCMQEQLKIFYQDVKDKNLDAQPDRQTDH